MPRPPRKPASRPSGAACLLCGGAAFPWGIPYEERAVGFLPGESVTERFFSLGPGPLKARRCDGCGHVDLFVASARP